MNEDGGGRGRVVRRKLGERNFVSEERESADVGAEEGQTGREEGNGRVVRWLKGGAGLRGCRVEWVGSEVGTYRPCPLLRSSVSLPFWLMPRGLFTCMFLSICLA